MIFEDKTAQVMMKINHRIIIFIFQTGSKIFNPARKQKNFAEIRIFFKQGFVFRFCRIMNFRSVQLLLQASDNRACEHDISDRAESYDEDFFQESEY
jgi:hypothetical protein